MFDVPSPVWPTVVLIVILFGDALMSAVPVQFIRDCMDGVRFPVDDWGWALVYVKLVAVAGLLVGIWQPGVGVAATAGVIAYFVAAAIAHLRARFLNSTFWVNCLGMLAISIGVLVYSYLI
ncbi:DoxX family protein [Gordonia phthalatica]|uniref:Membrane protein n=1 Tax=Gordonia phthalatica TaxID=1136941 RepID=A0A0N9NC12_9ACTN|nr:DoxX family protein [Gordonia phthalatica]ALG84569.1 membrane protein [Gordonia phthalatica]